MKLYSFLSENFNSGIHFLNSEFNKKEYRSKLLNKYRDRRQKKKQEVNKV